MGATYPIALFIHSWLRWAVLIGLVVPVAAILAFGRRVQ